MSRFTLLFLTLFGLSATVSAEPATALFAGGCFWCMESDYQDQPGVLDVVSGFTGGALKNPTYSGNHQGHFEAVKVTYDPAVISYQQLLDLFWLSVDPFDNRGQFCDKGPSYRSAIFPAVPRSVNWLHSPGSGLRRALVNNRSIQKSGTPVRSGQWRHIIRTTT